MAEICDISGICDTAAYVLCGYYRAGKSLVLPVYLSQRDTDRRYSPGAFK